MLIFIIALLVLVLLAEKWFLDKALDGVEFDYGPSVLLAAPNEKFDIITSLINPRLKFIPFLKVEGSIPASLTLHNHPLEVANKYTSEFKFSYTTFMTPRSGRQRNLEASISKRGRYLFTHAYLSGGDFLGLNADRHSYGVFNEIVVYPKEIDTVNVNEVVGGFLGDISVRRFIIEDPVLTAGFREYSGREPMKAISWTQSARMGQIMVKNHDFTMEPAVTVILNVESDYIEEEKETIIETCYSITHTVCKNLEERRIQYDFYTNATTQGVFGNWSYIPEGLGRKHFFTIMEGLGRASYNIREPFAATIKRLGPGGARSLIIISPTMNEDITAFLPKENAGRVLIIKAEEILS
ncbi:MAG: DUF58 domain-containing protein [Treponema sp.]|nr:DUF58 domain-containing protein [Treponema sp.]